MASYETHEFDVLVIGAGGAGLRAAIAAADAGVKTGLVCKSLRGKAHTVMAERGVAAALGDVYPEDNWRVHFRDTMRAGQLLNNSRRAPGRSTRSRRTHGSTRATDTPWRCGPGQTSSTWSSSSCTRRGWCGRRRCEASS